MKKASCHTTPHTLSIVAVLISMLFLCSTQILASPPGNLSDWIVTFQDEFTGSAINTSVWRTQYYWGRTNGVGLEWNLDENVIVSGGTLKLVTRKESPRGSACFGVPCTYSAGTIQSKVFNQTHGYFEASMKLPVGAGFLPAFWLLPEGVRHWEMPEVDIMEQFTSRSRHEIKFSHYWGKYDPEPAVGDENRGGEESQTYIGVSDYSAGFHVYGAEWDSDKIVFYVDDVERYRVINHVPQAGYFTGMYVLFTLIVGGTMVGEPDLNTVFPNQLEIDYVRVYKRKPVIFPLIFEGTIGTQLTLAGPNFGYKKGKVLVGGLTTKIISWTDSTITCEIKKPLPPGVSYDLAVQQKEPKGAEPIAYEKAFTMMAPEIVSFDPSGRPGETKTLWGNYFGSKKAKVYLEDIGSGKEKNCKVTSWSMDKNTQVSTLTFVVPKGLVTGTYLLKVKNKIGTTSAIFTIGS